MPKDEESNAIIEKVEEISELVLQLVNLLQLLVKEGYVLMLERGSNSKEPKTFGRCFRNTLSIDYTFKDQNIIDLFCEYTNKEFYVTEEFRRFCKKGYIARVNNVFNGKSFLPRLHYRSRLPHFFLTFLATFSENLRIALP